MTDPPQDSAEAERRRIAHDLSNQVMVVQGNLELIRLGLPREGTLGGHLELAAEAAERCRALAERLSELCRKPGSR